MMRCKYNLVGLKGISMGGKAVMDDTIGGVLPGLVNLSDNHQ
jgi:hypothetical protein